MPRGNKSNGEKSSNKENKAGIRNLEIVEEFSEQANRNKRKGVAGLLTTENPNRTTKKTLQKVRDMALDSSGEESSASTSTSTSKTTATTAAAAAAEDAVATSPARKSALNRRDREYIEKQNARKRYAKFHAETKTIKAKSDLERLLIIRLIEVAAKREAEKKAATEREAEK